MERYIIDRFEDSIAIAESENGGCIDIDCKLIPEAKRGDVLVFENGKYFVDEEETAKRKEIVSEKMRKLFAKKNNL